VQQPDKSGTIRRTATPLFIVLIIVETTDVTFATDSIPAIFAVTRDPFIIYTSNVCAVLGLRALYFLLANVVDKFTYLKLGLSLVLMFIGAKMLLEAFFHIPIVASLGVVAAVLASSILASLRWPREVRHPSPGAGDSDRDQSGDIS
jgi:tellurite resistance protein TerC